MTCLTLRQSTLSSIDFLAAFASIAPQLTALSLDLHRDDELNRIGVNKCTKLDMLDYFPTTSSADLLENYERPLRFLQLNDKTGANARAVSKATEEILRAFEKAVVSVSELAAIYLPESWNRFEDEKEMLRGICKGRAIELKECGSDDRSISAVYDRDYV